MAIEITLIGRTGCHLCEVAQGDLARVIAEFSSEYPDTEYAVNDLDIDQHPEFSHFSDEVPVLLINGQQNGFWRIDHEHVMKKLRGLA
jgi:hypothetical protein